MEELNKIVSENLVKLRQKSGYTQLQVAEKINYSDKSISKWERGEAIPDVSVMLEFSKLYNVSIDDICKNHGKKEIKPKTRKISQHTVITIISFFFVWFLATIGFAVIYGFYGLTDKAYLSFIVAIPVSLLVVMILSFIWYPYYIAAIFCSAFLWTGILAITECVAVEQIWLLYIIVVPVQLILIFSFILKYLVKKGKRRVEKIKNEEYIENSEQKLD